MTYHDNDRPNPNPRYNRNSSLMWMLGLAAVLIIGGLLFMTMGSNDNVMTRIDRPTATTGAGTTNPAAPRGSMGAPVQRPDAPAPAPK
jgi:hypothetical protein